nr:DUF5682 family protein [Kitasatospora sp. CB02891]
MDGPGPYLIGVRHHAPSIAAVLPALLDAARPDVLLVELPEEFQPWLGLLADERTEAPVALAAATAEEGSGPAFYPFADFSPELTALRWAARHGVPVVACDLPLAHRSTGTRDTGSAPQGLADALRRRLTGRPDEDLWDRLVEAPAPGSTPEEVRRAALLVGWALRQDAHTVDPLDLHRESWMRARIHAESVNGRRVTAVIGAFHAPALLTGDGTAGTPPATVADPPQHVATDAASTAAPGAAVGPESSHVVTDVASTAVPGAAVGPESPASTGPSATVPPADATSVAVVPQPAPVPVLPGPPAVAVASRLDAAAASATPSAAVGIAPSVAVPASATASERATALAVEASGPSAATPREAVVPQPAPVPLLPGPPAVATTSPSDASPVSATPSAAVGIAPSAVVPASATVPEQVTALAVGASRPSAVIPVSAVTPLEAVVSQPAPASVLPGPPAVAVASRLDAAAASATPSAAAGIAPSAVVPASATVPERATALAVEASGPSAVIPPGAVVPRPAPAPVLPGPPAVAVTSPSDAAAASVTPSASAGTAPSAATPPEAVVPQPAPVPVPPGPPAVAVMPSSAKAERSAAAPASVAAMHPGAAPSSTDLPSTPVPATAIASPAGPDPYVISLVPYTYPLLDARSGYPAGIRDPEWQHTVLAAGGDPGRLAAELTRTAVRICAALRGQGHPAGPADGREVVRVAGDLGRLRGLPAAGRGELIEAVQTVLAQGEPLGRGRAVARALEEVLVGTRTGRPTPAAPRTGLGPAVEALLAELGLPHAAEPSPRELRLDPHRSGLDARRELLLRRLEVCGVPYGEPVAVTGAGGADAVGSRWRVQWTPAVAAMLTVAGMRGVTPAQAADGTLRERLRREREAGGSTARQIIDGLAAAAGCALPGLTAARLDQLADEVPAVASLPELLDGLALLDRLAAGHLAGPDAAAPLLGPAAAAAELLTVAAVRGLDGLAGSDDAADARALVEFARRADADGGIRLGHALLLLADDGSPLIRGAAGATRVLLGHQEPAEFGGRVVSWVDAATAPDSRVALGRSLRGLLTAAEGLLAAAPAALEPLLARVTELPDEAFLDRLPALRGGFDTLSPAARDRLLAVVEERLGTHVDTLPTELDPATLAIWARADLTARHILESGGLLPATDEAAYTPDAAHAPDAAQAPDGPVAPAPGAALPPADRWRLVLGRRGSGPGPTGRSARLAAALDELYGAGRGEGSAPGPTGDPRGGREAPYPGVREWSEELVALFGPGIREEVLAAAAAHGRTDVLEALAPEAVRPSVDLLRTVLQHAGGLPEARLAALRPLVRRLVDELSRELATTLRPALTGLTLPRPSRRRAGPLDLDRTIRANLATARPGADGGTVIVPERPVFRTRAGQANDWRLILVVDVSGSMEASTVWAALTASILAGVPSLTAHFVAFSTHVVDLSGRVDDPLGLLLEVRVGGGTHIAAGLRYARDLVTVPSRTLIAVVSDFEEGYPLGGLLTETRALVGAGCHLLGCAALDDTGKPRYSKAVAEQLVAAGMPVAALSPLELARWVGEKIR